MRVKGCVRVALLAMVVLPAASLAEAEVMFGGGQVGPPAHAFIPAILPNSGHFDAEAGLFGNLFHREREPVLLPMPVPGGLFTSGYGMRRNPVTGAWVLHSGVDWSAPRGTPIMAAADGVVVAAGWESGYGRTTRILHANGIETTYAHQTAIAAGIVIGAEVIQEGRLRGDLLFVNIQLVNDDFFDALFDGFLVGHEIGKWV